MVCPELLVPPGPLCGVRCLKTLEFSKQVWSPGYSSTGLVEQVVLRTGRDGSAGRERIGLVEEK